MLLLYSTGIVYQFRCGNQEKGDPPSVFLGYHTLPEQFAQCPYMIRDASFDGRRNTKRGMDAAKVIRCFRIAAILRKYSGPRLAVAFPSFAPSVAAGDSSRRSSARCTAAVSNSLARWERPSGKLVVIKRDCASEIRLRSAFKSFFFAMRQT